MRILFLTHYFPPEVNAPASRTYEHCRQWVSEGHQVTVVTCVPNHPAGKIYHGYKNRLFQREEKEGIEVLRIWTYLSPNKGFFGRTVNYVTYLVMSILCVPFMPKSDVVISTSPQFFCGLAGYFVSRLKRIPWILEIRDIWPESIVAVGAIKDMRIIRILESMERFAYRKADKIVALTDAFKTYMLGKGILNDKIEVIKNGVDLSIFKPLRRDNRSSDELGLNGKFVVSYFGTHGMAHGLETALKAAKKLEDHKNILFLLVGDGAGRERILKLKEEIGLQNVMMLHQVPKEKMPHLFAFSDVCMVLLIKNDLFKTVIPSKIFEAMAMKRPIILGVEGESKAIIEKAKCGLCITPEDDQQLAEAVLKLYKDPQLTESFGENGRLFVEQNFTREKLAKNYLRLIEEVQSHPL